MIAGCDVHRSGALANVHLIDVVGSLNRVINLRELENQNIPFPLALFAATGVVLLGNSSFLLFPALHALVSTKIAARKIGYI